MPYENPVAGAFRETGKRTATTIANIATADGSDPATTQALANANKAKINALLTELRAQGVIA
jgi:hypothetical protein